MAKFTLEKNPTSVILIVNIKDSSKTDGSGLAGLDESSSIVGNFIKKNGLGIALAIDEDVTTEGTYQAPSSAAHVRIGSPANSRPGVYELHFHDDVFDSTPWVTMPAFGGATDMADLAIEVQCNLPTNLNALGIESDGDLTKCNLVAVTTENTDMYAEVMRGSDIETLNNISAADVNAQVSDVMKVDELPEIAVGVPPATPTFAKAFMYVYAAMINERTTNKDTGEDILKNSSGASLTKAIVTDDTTTLTKGKFGAL